MRRTFIAALLALAGAGGSADAGWLHGTNAPNPTPGYTPGTVGRQSWAGVPGLGSPLPASYAKPGTSPVVGSVSRTGHLVHPITGRTRYSGTAYNPTTGRFGTYRFKQ